MSEEQTVLEGAISVEAALKSGSRPIHKLLIRMEESSMIHRDVVRLVAEADRQRIPISYVNAEAISQVASGNTHGGIVALVGERQFVALDALVADITRPFVVMLDGVEDPFNFGQAVRAFYAAGADGLVLRPRNWMSAAGVVARASAGASELMPTAIAETTQDAADFFRAKGLRVAVAAKDRAESIYEADLSGPLFLVIGGEKRGVTRSFEDAADLRLSIPYGRRYPQSLGTTAASAVLAFEIMRQRVNISPSGDEL